MKVNYKKYWNTITITFIIFFIFAMLVWREIREIADIILDYWLWLTGTGTILYLIGKIMHQEIKVMEDDEEE